MLEALISGIGSSFRRSSTRGVSDVVFSTTHPPLPKKGKAPGLERHVTEPAAFQSCNLIPLTQTNKRGFCKSLCIEVKPWCDIFGPSVYFQFLLVSKFEVSGNRRHIVDLDLDGVQATCRPKALHPFPL